MSKMRPREQNQLVQGDPEALFPTSRSQELVKRQACCGTLALGFLASSSEKWEFTADPATWSSYER